MVSVSQNSGPEIGAYTVCEKGSGTFSFDVQQGGYYVFLRPTPDNTANLTGSVRFEFDNVSPQPLGLQ